MKMKETAAVTSTVDRPFIPSRLSPLGDAFLRHGGLSPEVYGLVHGLRILTKSIARSTEVYAVPNS